MTVALDFDSMISRGSSAGVPVALRQRGRVAVGPEAAPSCLVLTGDAALQRRLTAAAELAGWEADALPIDAAAPLPAAGPDCRLAVVDLAALPPCGRGAVEAFVREFGSRAGSLLVVCGSAGSVEHEAWARSMGAFVHVPGVAAGDSLISWFTEARIVSERRRPAPLRQVARRSAVVA